MFISVFTATYNRAYILPRLYDSLVNQTVSDFEWIIVDDASSDNTKGLIEGYKSEGIIKIKYFQKSMGGGKHRAINDGISMSAGDLFFIVDSDDYLRHDAIEKIEKQWELNGDDSLLGVCMRRVNPSDNKIIGVPFPKETKYASPETINFVWDLSCDKAEIFLTSVISENRFPEYDGEKFCTEALWVYQISKKTKRKFLVCNEGIRYTEYLDDRLTQNRRTIKKQNPHGYIEYEKMLLSISEFYRHPKNVLFTVLDLFRLRLYEIEKRKKKR